MFLYDKLKNYGKNKNYLFHNQTWLSFFECNCKSFNFFVSWGTFIPLHLNLAKKKTQKL